MRDQGRIEAIDGAPAPIDASPRARRRDGGFSVVEIVVTVAIIGITIIPILNAVLTNLRASASLGTGQRVETVLQNAADRINRAPNRCDYSVYAKAAAQSEGWDGDRVTVHHMHFERSNPNSPWHWVEGACIGNDTTPADLLVQLVEITVTSPDGRSERKMQVVKSDV